jgi:hypothetical protein
LLKLEALNVGGLSTFVAGVSSTSVTVTVNVAVDVVEASTALIEIDNKTSLYNAKTRDEIHHEKNEVSDYHILFLELILFSLNFHFTSDNIAH